MLLSQPDLFQVCDSGTDVPWLFSGSSWVVECEEDMAEETRPKHAQRNDPYFSAVEASAPASARADRSRCERILVTWGLAVSVMTHDPGRSCKGAEPLGC